mmetsp:Transcript_28810/g.26041  ORF Transcript_28810/g.26041 Transcript_28810/m.26041 type:complete len:103 (+) Transcript_28810:1196-1504(+)
MTQLTNQKAECELKLDRAHKLTSLLSDEKDRWNMVIGQLEEKRTVIPGDTTIAAGMVAYAGPFTAAFRQAFENEWIAFLKEIGVEFTEGINMKNFLGDSVKI